MATGGLNSHPLIQCYCVIVELLRLGLWLVGRDVETGGPNRFKAGLEPFGPVMGHALGIYEPV